MTEPTPDIFDGLEDDELTEDATPSPEPQHDNASADVQNQAVAHDYVTLRCPDSMTSLSHPEGAFPTVTNEGTEMTSEEGKLAKAAAKDAGKRLITVGRR